MILVFVVAFAALGVLSLGAGTAYLVRLSAREGPRAVLTGRGLLGIALLPIGGVLLYWAVGLWDHPLV